MLKEMKAILVGVSITSNQAEFEYSMEELGNLATACQIGLCQVYVGTF